LVAAAAALYAFANLLCNRERRLDDVGVGQRLAQLQRSRYEIQSYVWIDTSYGKVDTFVTARWYDLDAKADVLGSERGEVVARLKRVLPGVRQRAQWRV